MRSIISCETNELPFRILEIHCHFTGFRQKISEYKFYIYPNIDTLKIKSYMKTKYRSLTEL
jgi:hypothetical protein